MALDEVQDEGPVGAEHRAGQGAWLGSQASRQGQLQ